jgi:hypothetical protein
MSGRDVTIFLCVTSADEVFDMGRTAKCDYATLTNVLIDFSGAPVVYLDKNGDGDAEDAGDVDISYYEHLEVDVPWLRTELMNSGMRPHILLVHDRDILIEKVTNPKTVITLKPKQYYMNQRFTVVGSEMPQVFRVNLYDSDGVATRLFDQGLALHVYITLHNAVLR